MRPGAVTAVEARPASIKDWAVACLASERRLAFLAELVYWLSLEARGLYPPGGTDARRAVRTFICYNEAFQRLASQLRADSTASDGGHPDRALVEALLWDARNWGCEAGVRAALGRALAAVEP